MCRSRVTQLFGRERTFTGDCPCDEDVTQFVRSDTVAVIVARPAARLNPQQRSLGIVLGHKQVVLPEILNADLTEGRFGALVMPCDINVTSGISRDCVAPVNLVAATGADPQDLPLRINLGNKEIHLTRARQREFAKRCRTGEFPGQQHITGLINRNTARLIMLRAACRNGPGERGWRSRLGRQHGACDISVKTSNHHQREPNTKLPMHCQIRPSNPFPIMVSCWAVSCRAFW